MTLRTSTMAAEGVYQGSKWLKFQVLCDAEDFQGLFQKLSPFWIYPLTGIISAEQIPMQQEFFLNEAASWVKALKEGRIPADAELRRALACAFTADKDALWLQEIGQGRFLVKISKPVIQVQAHYFTYSPIDGIFRPMSMGPESIYWGIQLSFPQIYQDPKTMELLEVEESPNSELFQKVREWVREATRATPFIVEGKRVNVPIRLGKNCFSWISRHPQLIAKKIGVFDAS